MKVAVQDANILIDMMEGGFCDLWFALGIETHTTDQIICEINEPDQQVQIEALVSSGKLGVASFNATEMGEVVSLRMQNEELTIQDCSVLKLAERLDAMLLTGDKDLRSFSRKRHIEVHGTLWILDLLVDRKLLAPRQAVAKLEKLLNAKRRLPKGECRKRLRAWASS
ncbi:MAG: hypothetical protein ABFR33_00985 [Verrucomicrobiota bacterium]